MIRILSLIFYIMFVHVYPVVHWHVHEHDGDRGVHASVHPPDLPVETHDHDDDDEQHAHEDNHVVGTWEFVSKSQTVQTQLPEQTVTLFSEHVDMDSQVQDRLPREYPLKLPTTFERATESGRAPPYSS